MIRNITIGLLCGTSGVGMWAVTKYGLTLEDPWPYLIGLAWAVAVSAGSVVTFDQED